MDGVRAKKSMKRSGLRVYARLKFLSGSSTSLPAWAAQHPGQRMCPSADIPYLTGDHGIENGANLDANRGAELG